MEKITENVFVETGFQGCNTSIVRTTAGVVIIDTPMIPEEAQIWQREAAGFGPILYVINTEPHPDHAAGNYWFGARVVAHEGTRQWLTAARTGDIADSFEKIKSDSLAKDPSFYYRLPEITFSDRMTLHIGKHTFHLINMPGHTASETSVYVPEERVVFTGDNLNLHIPIFINALPYDWLESLQRLKDLDVDKIVPGHGQVSDKSCIEPMHEAVSSWINAVKSAVDRGWSLEETLEKVALAEKFPHIKTPPMDKMARSSITDLYEYFRPGSHK